MENKMRRFDICLNGMLDKENGKKKGEEALKR